MWLWLRKLIGFDDPMFSPAMVWGRCEAKWQVAGPIPYVTCSTRTNLRYKDHWLCLQHNPSYKMRIG